jgi:hypothetical protein
MALKLTIDKLEDVDEAARPLYVAQGDKFILPVELPTPEDTSGLKSALAKERKLAGELEKQTKRWATLGKTPDEIEQMLEAQAQLEADKAAKAGEWDKLRAQMNDKHALDLRTKDETITAMRKRLEAELVDAKAVAAIAAAKGVPELLLPHVQRHVKVDEHFNVNVVDAKGDPRVNGKGEPLSIFDLIAEMKATEIYGRAFEGSGQSGSGTRPTNGTGGAGAISRRSDFKTERQRADYVDAHGVEAYNALPLV